MNENMDKCSVGDVIYVSYITEVWPCNCYVNLLADLSSVTKKFVFHNFCGILNGNSLKLCMLAYYHMEIHILLQQFNETIL